MIKNIILLILTVIVVGTGGWVGWAWWSDWRHVESTDDAYVHADITIVRPKHAGHVVALQAPDNRLVARGTELVRLDDRDQRAALDQARAGVAARRAALGQLDAQEAVQRSLIVEAAARIDAGRAALTLARQELARATSLQRQDIASRQRLEAAEADLAKAEAGLRAAEAARVTAERQLALLDAQRGVAAAELARAEAQQAAAAIALDDMVIRAPVDGVIGNRGVELGDFVDAGAHLLALVVLDSVRVEANFKETQIGDLRPGQPARLEVDALPGRRIDGVIDSLAPATGSVFSLLPPENATGNFTKVVQRIPVRIRVPADAGLRPGLSVMVSIDTRAAGTPQDTAPR